jgi:HD superfamily phosphohydrolase YqeK
VIALTMTNDSLPNPQAERRSMLLGLAVLAALLIAGLLFALRYGATEKARALEQVRVQLSAGAEGAAAGVSRWLAEQEAAVGAIARNPAVQIYILDSGSQTETAQGQAAYLETLLEAQADRLGLARSRPGIGADVTQRLASGLAILDADGRTIAMAGGPLPSPAPLLADARQALVRDGALRIEAAPAMRLLAPIFAPGGGDAVLGYVYLAQTLDLPLKAALTTPGDAASSVETYVVRGSAAQASYVALLDGAGGASAVQDKVALAALAGTSGLIEAPGKSGAAMLAVAKALPTMGWTIVRATPARAALEPINSRVRWIVTGLSAALAAAAALVLLAWRHGASVRVAKALAQTESLRGFLALVADRQPAGIAVIEPNGATSFANARFKAWGGAIPAVFAEHITAVEAVVREARGTAEPHPVLLEGSPINGEALRLSVEARALDGPSATSPVLLVAHDLTELLIERERREATLDALVHTLTQLIDARDPDSKQHSEKVSLLAKRLAEALGWEPARVETVRTAGLLMNLGKILTPRDVLTRAGALSNAEKDAVRASMAQSAQMLRKVPFEGPVADVIADAHDAASLTDEGRLLTLANQFIGLVSARAHRQALTVDAALAVLRRDAGAAEQRLLSALAHHLDNQGGRTALGLVDQA